MRQDPLWWSRARELHSTGLSLTAVGKLLHKNTTSVLFAVDEGFRERRRAFVRQRMRSKQQMSFRFVSDAARARLAIVDKARETASITGEHIDNILVAWGEPPRKSR